MNALPPTTRKSMKGQAVGYWICTVLIGLSFLSGGAANLLRAPQVVEGMTHLGYTEFEHGAVAFFDLQPGLKLAIWPRESIAHDASIPKSNRSSTEITIGHNVRTKEDVDAVMAQAERAGARIVKPAHATFWGGYAGYFQDPDDHLWEVVWNPQFEVAE